MISRFIACLCCSWQSAGMLAPGAWDSRVPTLSLANKTFPTLASSAGFLRAGVHVVKLLVLVSITHIAVAGVVQTRAFIAQQSLLEIQRLSLPRFGCHHDWPCYPVNSLPGNSR